MLVKNISILGLLIIVFTLGCSGIIQSTDPIIIPSENNRYIKEQILKNFTLGAILHKVDYYRECDNCISRNVARFSDSTIGFPSFGYQPLEPICELSPTNFVYPDNSWKIFEATFPFNKRNLALTRFSSGYSGVIGNSFLIAFNQKEDIKYISRRFFLVDDIKSDFNLNKENPESYIPYIELKWYESGVRNLTFERIEDSLFVFKSKRKAADEHSWIEREYYMNPDQPDNIVKSKSIVSGSTFKDWTKLPYDTLNFNFFDTKKALMKDALMRNFYTHKFYTQFKGSTDIDDIRKEFLEKGLTLDVIPAYDEYLGQIKLMKKFVCWEDVLSFKKYINDQSLDEIPIYENAQEGKMIGKKYKKLNPNLEFYAFYRDTSEVLFKNDYSTSELDIKEFRYINKMIAQPIKDKNEDSLPPPMFDLFDKWENECKNNPPNFNKQAGNLYKHYLLAYNTETNKVYFISGDDISALRHNLNPLEYLTDVMRRLPDTKLSNLHQLFPANWTKGPVTDLDLI